MIISRTPVRVSFFGGGTDYPAWSAEHGGAVVLDRERDAIGPAEALEHVGGESTTDIVHL